MCDLLYAAPAATADGVALFAKNSDRPVAEAQDLEWHPPRRESELRTTYITIPGHSGETFGVLGSRPTWMWGMEHGVNTAGVAAGNATIFTTLDPRPFPPALVGMDLVRLALERAATAAAAVDVITTLLERHGQGGSGHPDVDHPYWSSFLVGDPNEAFVVETSGTEWMVEPVDGTRAISNRTTIASFDAEHRHPRQPVHLLVDPRWHASRDVLAAAGAVDRAVLQRHLRSHVGGDDGWTVCMHVRDVEATAASMVASLPDLGDGPPMAWCLLGSPCRSIYVPFVVGHPLGDLPGWERFAALGDDARPLLDALEAELDQGVQIGVGRSWNVEASRRISAALDQLEARALAPGAEVTTR